MTQIKEECRTCEWYLELTKGPNQGEMCRRFPPKPIIMGREHPLTHQMEQITVGVLPPIMIDGACGEYVPKELMHVKPN